MSRAEVLIAGRKLLALIRNEPREDGSECYLCGRPRTAKAGWRSFKFGRDSRQLICHYCSTNLAKICNRASNQYYAKHRSFPSWTWAAHNDDKAYSVVPKDLLAEWVAKALETRASKSA